MTPASAASFDTQVLVSGTQGVSGVYSYSVKNNPSIKLSAGNTTPKTLTLELEGKAQSNPTG